GAGEEIAMALEGAFQELSERLHRLREALLALRVTVVEDRPLLGDVVFVDLIGDGAAACLGWLEEAIAAIGRAQPATGQSWGLAAARWAAGACQEQLCRITGQFTNDLHSYERIGGLMRMGRRRGGEWQAWTVGVKHALDR